MTGTVPSNPNDSRIVRWQVSILPYKPLSITNNEAKSSHVSVHSLYLLEIVSILDTINVDPVYGMEFCFPKGNGSEKIRRDTKPKCFL